MKPTWSNSSRAVPGGTATASSRSEIIEGRSSTSKTRSKLTRRDEGFLADYFLNKVFPVLSPLAIDPAHPFPYISGLSLNLAVTVRDTSNGAEHFARVKVPDNVARFLREGKAQSTLILVGIAVGVAVIVFLTALITGLQGNIVNRTLGTQAHIKVMPTEEANRILPPAAGSVQLVLEHMEPA